MRVACLRVPDLPLAAWRRAEPTLATVPLAVFAGAGPRAEIVAACAAATRAGIRAGQTVAQARAIQGALQLRACAPALEQAAREALRDVALSFSPRTEPAPPGRGVHGAEAAFFLDASGMTSLFRSEAGFGSALAARAAALGLPALVSVASARAVALLAARAPGEPGAVRVLAPGQEAAWLAPLAVDLLDPPDELAEAFTRFGIRRLGELARLPTRALATRLGPEALRLAALARGEGDSVPIEAVAESTLEEALELEAPLERLEPLAFALRGLLSHLASRLELRGFACSELALELGLAGGGRDARRIGLAAPTLDPKTLLRVVCLALESRPPVRRHRATAGLHDRRPRTHRAAGSVSLGRPGTGAARTHAGRARGALRRRARGRTRASGQSSCGRLGARGFSPHTGVADDDVRGAARGRPGVARPAPTRSGTGADRARSSAVDPERGGVRIRSGMRRPVAHHGMLVVERALRP